MATILEEIRFLQETNSSQQSVNDEDEENVPLESSSSSVIGEQKKVSVQRPEDIVLPPSPYTSYELVPHNKPKPQPRPMKNGFKTCCIGCFGTRQLVSKVGASREAYIRTTLVELVVYIIYLSIFCFIVFGSVSTTAYYYTRVLSDLFLDTPFNDEAKTTFRTSCNIKDFWKFAETTMPNGLYWEQWYDDPMIHKEVHPQDQGILYENRLVGLPRLRQIRVKPINCSVDHLVRSAQGKCYPEYASRHEDTGRYDSSLNGPAWEYHSEETLKGGSYWGKLATYSGSGVYQLLDKKQAPTLKIIQDLKQNLWVKRSTRVIFLDFTVYNSNLNMFCVVKLAWEFSVAGGLITSSSIHAVRLFNYVSTLDFVIFGCEICFILFTFYYTLQELIELFSLGPLEYLSDPWSYLDILILSLSYCGIGFSIYKYLLIQSTIHLLIRQKNDFSDFDYLAFWETQFWNIAATCLIFAWIKIFKYISFNATMSQLSITLSRCAKHIAGFSILFCIVFIAFAQLGYLLFGSQVEGFSTVYSAIFTLARLILGDFNFAEIETANRVLGPIYFLAYVFFVFFVLLNMFLAIINDTYSKVHVEIQSKGNEFQITDYVEQKVRRVGAAITRNTLITEKPLMMADSLDNGKITPDELRQHLIRAQFSETEVDLFMERYELTDDHALDYEETERLITRMQRGTIVEERRAGRNSVRLSIQKRSPRTTGDQNTLGISVNEIEQLDERITTMEGSLSGVLAKMDLIMSRITQTDESL